MDQPFLRLLIQEKLADGRLPRAPIPRMWGGPGHGETCDGCGEIVTSAQTVMENLDDPDGGVQLHAGMLPGLGRRASGSGTRAERPSSGPIRVRSSGARPGRPWAPSAPPARPAQRVTVTPESASEGGRYARGRYARGRPRGKPSVDPASPSLLPETRDRMCPACRNRAVVGLGPVTATATGIRCAYRCPACATEFVLVFSMRRMIETDWSTPGAP